MKAQQLREKYLQFFKKHGHSIIPSASLIPDNDPTVLFTTAGMHPLVPYLMGEKHPGGKRVASVQKCVRTGDIDEVGDTTHLTFFEMLGNWSFGDYFKGEAIAMSFEFLTQELKLPLNRLAVTIFAGDSDAPRDEESAGLWKKLGISKDRIAYLPKSDNWWGPAGATGPCGPDTEMFYWVDNNQPPPRVYDPKDKRWVEIWNDVFMQYFKEKDGTYSPLKQKNVDTGMGLERTLSALNGLTDVYQSELFLPAIQHLEKLSAKNYDSDPETTRTMRIIADHLRAAVFMLGDEKGIGPSNTDQGYILRRLIRRAVVKAKNLNLQHNFCSELASIYITMYQTAYPELINYERRIVQELTREEEKFKKALERGLREFTKLSSAHAAISGKAAFDLYQNFGFPKELTTELMSEAGQNFDSTEFDTEFKKHQELSRAGAEKKFKGGLADASQETVKGHTATHLLLASLRKVLGSHVFQKGSNITSERLRFDFSHPTKMTPDEIKRVEAMVNEQIQKKIPVEWQEMSLDEAKKQNAMGVFDSKYQERVKVYTIGDFSKEICGGPHVQNTRDIQSFKIIEESASSAGVRRIKAVMGK